ncbi:MAG: acetyl-CoA carboxylase biotin carboxyl carrier protein [Phycisphaerae bacterium]|nr:acetyl-CoA carboxylase biotin carboxyl carrier protein [Phycisphaerae bacterium]
MTPEGDDLKRIKELIQIMEAHDLAEIQIERGDDKIRLRRTQPPGPSITALPGLALASGGSATERVAAGASPSDKPPLEEGLVEIKAPLVGTFYQASSPDADPYVEVGSSVEPKTVVCIVEAMKVMNEIKAEVTGTIVAVLAKNGQAVQYGQPLFKVRTE